MKMNLTEVTLDWIKERLPDGELLVRRDGKKKIQDTLYVANENFDVAIWNMRAGALRVIVNGKGYPIRFAYNPGELRAYEPL